MRRPLSLSLVFALCLPVAVASQSRLGPAEKRPKLVAGADTNDAAAYFSHASRLLEEKPEEAAAAFYWAARLDPSSAEALDGRRAALLMKKPTMLKLYMEGGRRARANKELRAIDSLQFRALRLDPLYYRKYDHIMLMDYYRTDLRRAYPTASSSEIDLAIRDYLTRGSHYMRGWTFYAEGRMAEALEAYGMAMKNVKNKGGLHLERARVMTLQGHLPKAVEEFRLAADAYVKVEEDKDEDVVFYNSKALIEHSAGVLYARMNQPDSAKAALGRAITEDLSYFAAHLELGRLALALKDTSTALSEFALAAELAADEPVAHYLQGMTLVSAGQPAEAVAPLRKAIELEPMYAGSHFVLGQALDRTGDAAGARASYGKYLALAPRRDLERRDAAKQRLAALPQ